MAYKGNDAVNTYRIRTATDLNNLASGGVITISQNTQLIFENTSSITTSNRFNITGGALQLNSIGGVRSITYTGGGTFFTLSGSGELDQDEVNINGSTTGTLFDSTSSGQIEIENSNFTAWSNLGEVKDGGSLFVMRNCLFVIFTDGLYLDVANMQLNTVLSVLTSEPSSLFLEITTKSESAQYTIQDSGSLGYPSTPFRISQSNTNGMRCAVNNCVSSSSSLFDTSGTTGTFTAVADASITSTTITSVTDNSGVARFNFTGGTVYVNQEVVISGFVTNTTYNTTGIITATDGTSYFEIRDEYTQVAYTGTEASVGSFTSDSVTLTDTGTTLANNDYIKIETDNSSDYDGSTQVYNKQTNSVQVNRAWTVSQTGEWSKQGLDQSDKRNLATGNRNFVDSKAIAYAHIEGNTTFTTISASDTYQDINITGMSGSITAFATNGAGGTTVTSATHELLEYNNIEITGTTNYNGLYTIFNVTTNTFDISKAFTVDDATGTWYIRLNLDDITQRFKLINSVTGEIEYTGAENFIGIYTVIVTASKTGNAESYLFSVYKNGVLVDHTPYIRRVVTTASSITIYEIPVELSTGDRLRPIVSAVGGTDNILFSNVEIRIS